MLKFLDKLIKRFKNNQKEIILESNEMGKITMKYDILYSILDDLLYKYPIFEDAEIDFDLIDDKKNLYRLYIIIKGSLKDISENRLKILKNNIIASFKKCGFPLINVIITSEESIRE